MAIFLTTMLTCFQSTTYQLYLKIKLRSLTQSIYWGVRQHSRAQLYERWIQGLLSLSEFVCGWDGWVFHHLVQESEVATRLFFLCQGSQSAANYSIDSCISVAWNEPALACLFKRGLSERLQDELASREEAASLELVTLAIHLDNQLREWGRDRERRHHLAADQLGSVFSLPAHTSELPAVHLDSQTPCWRAHAGGEDLFDPWGRTMLGQ